jgi:hypothetical protein
MASRNAPLFACVLALAAGASCADGGEPIARPADRPLVARLTRASNCEDVLEALRADASAKVGDQAWQMMANYDSLAAGDYTGLGGRGGGIGTPVAGGAEDGAAEGPSHFTDTNTQVEGVDEPDFVKTDGERIFLLHGEELLVFRSWPAAETAQVGAFSVEGAPTSMFLVGDEVVLFSNVSFVSPSEGGGAGGGLGEPAIGTLAPDAVAAADVAWGGAYPYAYRSFTKITVLDVSSDAPAVRSERYVEGWLRDARRHDSVVRAVFGSPTWEPQWGGAAPRYWDDAGELVPRHRFEESVKAWRDERLAAIEARDLDGFLPDELVKRGDALVAVSPRCEGFYAPAAGQTAYGMAEVLTMSLDDLDTSESVYVLGSPSVIYANHDVLLVTQDDWRWSGMGFASEHRTIVHELALAGVETRYVGSGVIDGGVKDQFALDEADGVVRVAVTEEVFPEGRGDVWTAPTTQNRVLTLTARDGELVELGATPPMAEGERIFSVRYVGDRAYVVTYRQIDPLFAVDLHDPARPEVLGEVEIPGFSTYMHPLAEGYLLTIGRSTDPMTGASDGLALQIFDVTDPSSPQRTQVHVVPGYSSAEWDHKAFVFDPVSSLLAVPVDSYAATFESSLRLFHVSIDEGFAEAGAIDHTALFDGCVEQRADAYFYGCGYSSSMRRGLFIDDYVYAISYGGLTTHAVADPSVALATVPLAQPQFYPYYALGAAL